MIEATAKTPEIMMDPENGIFRFSGESRPENVRQFYLPVIEWLGAFKDEAGSSQSKKLHNATCIIQFEYFNSTSAKYLLDIFKAFQSLVDHGCDIRFKWLYEEEDEDMQEVGEEMSRMSRLDFEFVVVDG